MNYAVALLFNLIGFFEEQSQFDVSDPHLGSFHFVSYAGSTGKCAVHFAENAGDQISNLRVDPSVDLRINPHYIGLNQNGPNPMDYYTYYKLPHSKQGPGDYVLLNQTSDFNVTFKTKSEILVSKKTVHCDAKSCTCTVKP